MLALAVKQKSAEAGEVVRDGDVLTVGSDDFDGGVVRGDVAGIVDEPNQPTGGIDKAVGTGVGIGRDVHGGVGKQAEVFGDRWIVV
jgi:hypothetical protein